jgi:flagellar assembly factor FliW
VVDPRLVDPAYAPELDEVDRAALGVTDDDSVGWLSILTVQNDPFKVTANLLGPIAFNPRTGAARQVLLSQSGYAAAHPLGDGRLLMGSEVDHARSYATV